MPDGFSLQVVATGLTEPTSFAFLPDGRVLVTEKSGTVRLVKDGVLLAEPLLDLRGRVNDFWERGLLDVAVDPGFADNGFIYLLYVYDEHLTAYQGGKTVRVSRFTVGGDLADPNSESVLLGGQTAISCNYLPVGADCLPADTRSHTGGALAFAADGSLFVSTGDASRDSVSQSLRAQNLDLLAGKVLRVNPDGTGLPTNPFYTGDPHSNRSKVWASGLRNPFRLALHPTNGVPYVGDVGERTWEEINAVPRGANLGWPCLEGVEPPELWPEKPPARSVCESPGGPPLQPPLFAYDHPLGPTVIGGAFYTGSVYPQQYQGAYFFADHARSEIRFLRVDDEHRLIAGPLSFISATGNPTAIEMGPDGQLWYSALSSGELIRIHYGGPTVPTPGAGRPTFVAEYFANPRLEGSPVLTQHEAGIGYTWGVATPSLGQQATSLSVRWNGTFPFREGRFAFTARADDGIRIWLDDELIVDAWDGPYLMRYEAIRTLTDGEHRVKVEYHNDDGPGLVQVRWLARATDAGG